MKHSWKRRIFSFIIAIGAGANLFGGAFLTVHAEETDYRALAESNKLMTVESNEIEGWPQGPAVSARSAILMEANTGTILYEKNVHERLYPASTTKILTAYIARQNSSLDEMVEYSAEAVNSINWWEDANIGIKPGEALTMEQSLYSLMVGSANECANAIGEHVSGSIEAFVELMNQTAQELGCLDSHFVTTNGKHDENHYTTAYDMALIAQKYFSDELLCKMSNTASYVLPESPTLSRELIPNTKNQLLAGKKYAYEYLVGSKTGYTDIARQSLISCAEKDGLKLICVVMQDESPMQFTDTVDLFNYGFSNFKAVNIAENDTTYNIGANGNFLEESSVFGNSDPILSIDRTAYLVLPADITFEDLTSELSYDGLSDHQAALIHYSYKNQPLGVAPVLFSQNVASFDFNAAPVSLTEEALTDGSPESTSQAETAPSVAAAPESAASESEAASVLSSSPKNHTGGNLKNQDILLLDIKRIGIAAGGIALLAAIVFIIYKLLHNHRLSKRRRAIMSRRRRKSSIIDFDRYTNDNY